MAKILIVDDNAPSRELIREVLQSTGTVIVEANDGNEALAAIAAEEFDLVLMDIQMPGLDGYAAIRRIRSDERTRSLRVVALTAYAMRGDLEKAIGAGFDAYITKPIDLATLRKRVDLLLRNPGSGI
jgi:CheY-like chemotaxis protein